MTNSKLVFILPELDTQTSNHYWHIYELLQEIGKNIDVFLFAEQGKFVPKKGTIKKIYIQKFHCLPIRLMERWVVFLFLNFQGYRVFYVHQSIMSSIIVSVLGHLFGAKTFFWHCGKIHIYEKELGRKNWLFRLNLKLIDYLVTAPLEMKKYYQKNFAVPARKIKLFPGWVNIQRFRKVDQGKVNYLRKKLGLGNKKVILFVHWLSPRKGSRNLVEIVTQALQKRNDLFFVIVGIGPDFQWLKRELAKRNLLKSVWMVGAIPNQKIPLYLRMADVFILPSQEEELGRVHLEAMAAEVPIVAFATEGSRGLLSKAQKRLMIAKGNIKEFIEAMEKALRKKEFFIKLGQKQVRQYSIKNGTSNFLRLIGKSHETRVNTSVI
ncbi:hypothetical protein A2160_02760 [Candidatus Beckwithbacteria bacterium RBG_13_42_9]|uniref:Glycosyl transferase family 1 domain-containing protein n=1 Tax=Candidatus Beckwithbacteria bacterium RBG_13_42_9 TaxID=1797457 RepID=A0A1F5E7K4_9BACT|nr:MAG: hypothetical protein A2160_02760 [Candidatus Beckwithbacteria bacterium RBG_13_42_9]